MKRALSVLVVGAVVGLMGTVSCGGSEKSATGPSTQVDCVLLGLRVSPSLANLQPGDTLRALALNNPPCYPAPTTGVTQWRSSNTSIATVGATDGLVRALSRGQVTIIASDPRDPSVQGAMALVVQ